MSLWLSGMSLHIFMGVLKPLVALDGDEHVLEEGLITV